MSDNKGSHFGSDILTFGQLHFWIYNSTTLLLEDVDILFIFYYLLLEYIGYIHRFIHGFIYGIICRFIHGFIHGSISYILHLLY